MAGAGVPLGASNSEPTGTTQLGDLRQRVCVCVYILWGDGIEIMSKGPGMCGVERSRKSGRSPPLPGCADAVASGTPPWSLSVGCRLLDEVRQSFSQSRGMGFDPPVRPAYAPCHGAYLAVSIAWHVSGVGLPQGPRGTDPVTRSVRPCLLSLSFVGSSPTPACSRLTGHVVMRLYVCVVVRGAC